MSQAVSNTIIEGVLSFVKAGSAQRGSNPGFSHALKLSYRRFDKERLSITRTGSSNSKNNKVLTYRYQFGCKDVPTATVGTLTAIMDDLHTYAIFACGMPSPPGASLLLQTELFNRYDLSKIKEVDFVNKVSKFGRTIVHAETDFVDVETGQKLGHGTHVKYMPSGSRVLDFMLSNKLAYKFASRFLFSTSEKSVSIYPNKNLPKEVIADHLEFQGISGRATFHITREHTNPNGMFHGGCQAMVIEQVATVFAKTEFTSDQIVLENMQVEYFKAAKAGTTVEIYCEALSRSDDALHVKVCIHQPGGGGKKFSEAKLRFLKMQPKSKL